MGIKQRKWWNLNYVLKRPLWSHHPLRYSGCRPGRLVLESHKTGQSFFYRPFESAASHHPTTDSLIRTTIISCQYPRIASELTTLFPSTPVRLPFSRHMQHFAALEFCFLPVVILFFHKSRLKVTFSVKCLLTAPAPHNCFLQLHLSVLPPPP